MHHEMVMAVVALLAANSGKSFHIGPWIIMPILIMAAIIGTPMYIARDRRKRRRASPPK